MSAQSSYEINPETLTSIMGIYLPTFQNKQEEQVSLSDLVLAHILTILDNFEEKDFIETSSQLDTPLTSVKCQLASAQSEIRDALQNRLTPGLLNYRIHLN
jgi:hypothetical protein